MALPPDAALDGLSAANVLPPASDHRDEAVTQVTYSLRSIRAPALAGTTLNVFVRLLESFLGSLILLKLRRDSGIPQALAEVSLPERPSYYAVHPQLQEEHESWLPLAESSAPERANAAAQEVPGRSCPAGFEGVQDHVGRLQNPLHRPHSLSWMPADRRQPQDCDGNQEPKEVSAAPQSVLQALTKCRNTMAGRLISNVKASKSPHSKPAGFGQPQDREGNLGPQKTSISNIHAAFKSGTTNPTRLAQAACKAIRLSNEMPVPMNIFINHDAVDAMAQAATSAARWEAGKPLSVLDGVPYAVKDNIDAIPYPTTSGSAVLQNMSKATEDHPMVAELRSCGAVLLGKTNMTEFGLSPMGGNVTHGIPRNPHDPRHYTGASSSGSAAAVAAGLCPFAIGNDGGGSIRIPAAACGIFGIKPTFGRDATRGTPQLMWSVTSQGPLAGCVADAMIVYAVTANAGMEGSAVLPAPTAIPRPLPAAEQPGSKDRLAGKRFGVYWDHFQDAEPEVVRICRQAVDTIRDNGGQVVDISIPELELVRNAHLATFGGEACNALKHLLAKCRRKLSLETRATLRASEAFGAAEYVQAQQIRTRAIIHLARLFDQVDFIVLPSLGITAPPIREEVLSKGESNLPVTGAMIRFTFLCNMTGHPAASVPIGLAEPTGLPVGLQLIGKPWHEADVLHASAVIEGARADSMRPPQVYFDMLHLATQTHI